MRISWLIPLAALALAGCQAREPQAPGRPGGQADAPSATAPVPPAPTLEPKPQTAAAPGLACPPARACPPAARSPVRKTRAARPPATQPQRRERSGQVRREVDIPPYGGYRYEELEDREIQRRYAQRRYEAERQGRVEERRSQAYREYDSRGPAPSRVPPAPPPQDDAERPSYGEAYRQDDRYSGGYARGGGYERREEYVERSAPGGVRRYEERSYEESSSYRESGSGYVDEGLCCARPAEAAGRDANGFLTWPGKVPAIP